MDFIAPKKYTDLMDRVADGETVDKAELEDAIKEYEEALENFSQLVTSYIGDEATRSRSISLEMASLVSKAKNERKKKLTPLGMPKKETEEGQ